MMKPGYKMLMRCLGEAILAGTLGKREKTLAKALYADMRQQLPISPEWDPKWSATQDDDPPALFGGTPPPPTPSEVRETVVAPAAAQKQIKSAPEATSDDEIARSLTLKKTDPTRKFVTRGRDSAGYHGENPLE
jgi:hypothetical protein